MYFRHHSIEIYAKDFLKLDYSFWTNDCPLAEPCVKSKYLNNQTQTSVSEILNVGPAAGCGYHDSTDRNMAN